MATKKPKRKPLVRTPLGTLQFPKLLKPEQYKGKGDYSYSALLLVSEADAKPFIETAEARFEEHVMEENWSADQVERARLTRPWKRATDADKNPIPGFLTIKVAVKAGDLQPDGSFGIRRKDGTVWDRKPVFFDGSGAVIPTDKVPSFGFGTEARFNVEPRAYFISATNCGLSLQLREVQLIKIVNLGGAPTGFDAVEGGYTAIAQPTQDETDAVEDEPF